MNLHQSLIQLGKAQQYLATRSDDTINWCLNKLADNLESSLEEIITANKEDLARMDIKDTKYDRLALDVQRIKAMAEGLRSLAGLKTPIDQYLESRVLKNKLKVKRIRVPLGVIGMIYEARPNVTTDAFGIAFKTKNAVALKGGSDAQATNEALLKVIQSTLEDMHLPKELVYLLPAEREHTKTLMEALGMVDVIIPRGSQGLIKFVRSHAKVPVIETGAGIVHTYWDDSGLLDCIKPIVFSAKTRRPSVCNSLDTLIVHATNLVYLPEVIKPLLDADVEIRADKSSFEALKSINSDKIKRAQVEDFGTEFLGLCMSIKMVDSLEDALNHIALYSSKHSEAIVTENADRACVFLNQVDAACVFHNTETGFSDGEQLELGAEIGISTQKLHARGPMGLEAMTSYKWVVEGEGQTRI